MTDKILCVVMCFFIAGTGAFSVEHAPTYGREFYVATMFLYLLSGAMIYWVAEFITDKE